MCILGHLTFQFLSIAGCLHFKHLCITTTEISQFLMIAILGNSAVFEHDNTIRHAHGGESVRNKKSSFAGRKIGKSLEDCVFAARIQRSSGLVKDEHLRVAEIRERQSNFLTLTS